MRRKRKTTSIMNLLDSHDEIDVADVSSTSHLTTSHHGRNIGRECIHKGHGDKTWLGHKHVVLYKDWGKRDTYMYI